MNDSYLADDDYSGVQSVEDIRALLSEAQTPGPSKYNFQEEGGDDYVDMIDAAIGGCRVSCWCLAFVCVLSVRACA